MSRDQMDALPLAALLAIAAGVIRDRLPNGDKKPTPVPKLDWASI